MMHKPAVSITAYVENRCKVKRLMRFAGFVLFAVLATLVSCSPIREAVTPEPAKHSLHETLSGLKQNETSFTFLNTRFSGSANIEGVDYSISGTLRIKNDSAIFVSVSPLLGIEIARLLVTPDTLKLVNRLDNTFYAGNMEIINKILGTCLDFQMLQALLTGNDFNHFSSSGFNVSEDNGNIVLFTQNRYPLDNTECNHFQHRILLNSQTFRIMENLLHDPESRRSLQVKYHGFSLVDGQYVPQEVSMVFSDTGGQTSVNLRFSRVVLNEERSLVFNIPGHYRQIQL